MRQWGKGLRPRAIPQSSSKVMGRWAGLCYDRRVMDEENPEENPEQATPLLAVVRIVSVLGMSFGIAFGLFLLLGAWWLPALASFASAVPFFVVMSFVEKHTGADDAAESK